MLKINSKIREKLCRHYPSEEVKALSRIISTEILGIKEYTYFLKDPVTLTPQQEDKLDETLRRLQEYEPIQHILGCERFCGLNFAVNNSVLIPRPETQELVSWIIKETPQGAKILDIGTGSGCIAIAIAHNMPDCKITAWDISDAALATAQKNCIANSVNIHIEQCNILTYTPLENEKFDIIVSNPPYIKESEKSSIEPNVLRWEPHIALFVPDSDPLIFYRTIAQKAQTMLRSGGKLFFEINRAHGDDTVQLLKTLGYCNIKLRKDFADNDRMIKAQKSHTPT